MNKINIITGGALLILGLTFGYGVARKMPESHIGEMQEHGGDMVTSDGSTHTFDSTDAEEEGYWYSRYNLGNLSMRSGMGDIIKPDKAHVLKAMQAVDADFNMEQFKSGNKTYGDGDHVTPPQNVAPIKTVYKSGDPHFITKFNPADFGTQRWDRSKMDKTLTGLANGFTILKEVEWARQFHVDEHFGTPKSNFGAYWRFVGMMMTMNAKMQAKSFMENMAAYDMSNGGNATMLMAMSDLADFLSVEKLPHSDVPNRYKDTKMAPMMKQTTDMLFTKVVAENPTSIRELARNIQALVWYAAKTDNIANKKQAAKKITTLAKSLAKHNPVNATARAWYLRGLVEAHRTLGVTTGDILPVAAAFLADFNNTTGGFNSQSEYTIDDIGTIIGALNALRTFETADVDADRVNEVFKIFHEIMMNKNGMILSTPPISVAKSKFEYEGEPTTYFRYGPSQPVPPMAGGKFGVAPVFASKMSRVGNTWKVTDARFDTAGAMHTSNEMIWLHYDEINGFPTIDLSDVL